MEDFLTFSAFSMCGVVMVDLFVRYGHRKTNGYSITGFAFWTALRDGIRFRDYGYLASLSFLWVFLGATLYTILLALGMNLLPTTYVYGVHDAWSEGKEPYVVMEEYDGAIRPMLVFPERKCYFQEKTYGATAATGLKVVKPVDCSYYEKYLMAMKRDYVLWFDVVEKPKKEIKRPANGHEVMRYGF